MKGQVLVILVYSVHVSVQNLVSAPLLLPNPPPLPVSLFLPTMIISALSPVPPLPSSVKLQVLSHLDVCNKGRHLAQRVPLPCYRRMCVCICIELYFVVPLKLATKSLTSSELVIFTKVEDCAISFCPALIFVSRNNENSHYSPSIT